MQVFIGEIEPDSLYTIVKFNPVSGGSSGILFIGVTKEYNGDKIKNRLTIDCREKAHQFSVSEILKWPLEVAKDSVYIAPKICE